MNEADETQQWLQRFIGEHGAVAGTVHRCDPGRGETLELDAAVNIPPKVREVTAVVPRGKGMAGLALQRGKPVSTCNLETDETGDVRPGAKAVEAKAAVALPVRDEQQRVRAVVGIAWMDERDITDEDLGRLTEAAASLP